VCTLEFYRNRKKIIIFNLRFFSRDSFTIQELQPKRFCQEKSADITIVVLKRDQGSLMYYLYSFSSFFEKLRKISCMMLGASLRDSSRETRREKDRLSAWIKKGGTEAHINDKRVHESLANVLISGERRAREKAFSF